MKLSGTIHKFGDDVNTDYIISGRYKFKSLDMNDMAQHVMEDLDPDFYKKVVPGKTFIVAGRNWGCGSSREQAPLVIKYAGINAVIAKSFARLFYRNAINIGLPVIECDTDQINQGDEIEVDLESGVVRNLTTGKDLKSQPMPDVMIRILQDGGLAEHLVKHGTFQL